MEKTAIIFGSSSGNTEIIAKQIAEKIGNDSVSIINVSEASTDDVEKYSNLILGSSTWGIGDLQDDWELFLPQLAKSELTNKTIALFGLGDSMSYPDSFVDAIGSIYNEIKDKGCKLVGFVSTAGYSFDYSTAVVDDNFIGLPLDTDNESDKTEERIDNWLKSILPSFN